MRIRIAAAAAALMMATGTALVGATPAQAAGPAVQFTKIFYDSPGTDVPRTTKKLNAEYARITNKTKKAITVNGWTIRDASGHVYTFQSYTLKPGKSVTLHTGKGTNGKPAGNLYWGSRNYIWNNPKDTATLKNARGTTIDTCAWKKNRAVTTC